MQIQLRELGSSLLRILDYTVYQYIKILTVCLCVSVCVCVMEVGCSWGGTRLVTYDLRTCIYCTSNSAKNVREHWAWAGNSWRGAAAKADAIGEQQLKRTQSRAAAEADASGEQQLKRMQQFKRIDAITRGAAAEADAIGEHQLCTESCPALDYSRR